ncbi:hypothetical protein [Chitinophaga caseinilytica]|uniref:Lipocalin-like domain-containing protein n=1 Tax=Chitinophaga caseinilytica TaxID=2267521 RepID=A0ABZ2Z633_9BACT
MRKICLLLLWVSVLHGCSSNDNNDNSPGAVTSGSWRVSTFSERGSDETGDFAGYTFTFSANGQALAVKGGVSKAGSWSMSGSSRFNVDFGAKSDANKPLGELTDDWKIISVSGTQIKLTDDNPSSAEFLTFTKN